MKNQGSVLKIATSQHERTTFYLFEENLKLQHIITTLNRFLHLSLICSFSPSRPSPLQIPALPPSVFLKSFDSRTAHIDTAAFA